MSTHPLCYDLKRRNLNKIVGAVCIVSTFLIYLKYLANSTYCSGEESATDE
jgi:hypothetical protein